MYVKMVSNSCQRYIKEMIKKNWNLFTELIHFIKDKTSKRCVNNANVKEMMPKRCPRDVKVILMWCQIYVKLMSKVCISKKCQNNWNCIPIHLQVIYGRHMSNLICAGVSLSSSKLIYSIKNKTSKGCQRYVKNANVKEMSKCCQRGAKDMSKWC